MRPTRSARCLLATFALLGALPLSAAEFRDDFSNPASGWPHGAATRDTDLGFAVYTDSGHAIHILRKVFLRVSTKLDWLILKLH